MRRTTASRAVAALVTVAALALGGCTLSADGDQAAPSPDQGRTTGSTPAPSPGSTLGSTGDGTPSGPTPEELSAEVLAVAAAPLGEPVASQTVVLQSDVISPSADPDVTFEVLRLQRRAETTLLTFQMSSSQDGVRFVPDTFTDRLNFNQEFWTRFALEDTGNGTRYLPLSWNRPDEGELDPADSPANSCICPYRGNNIRLTPTPIVFDVLYGPLPEDVTTVDLTAPDGVSVTGLTVEPAPTR